MVLPTLAVCSGGGGEASSPDSQAAGSCCSPGSQCHLVASLPTLWGLEGPWRAAWGEPLVLS